jgi:hypothetical protein
MYCRRRSSGSASGKHLCCVEALPWKRITYYYCYARQNALATWTEVKTLHRQQHSHIQRNTQTSLDLWNLTAGTASTSKTEILERFQTKVLRTIVDAPWYVPNTDIRRDFQTPTVKEEIRHYRSQYSARLSVHPNDPVVNLMAQPENR